MILLDTNILSALMQQAPDVRVVSWLDQQPRSTIWTTSVTVLEIRFGLQIMASGKRRQALSEKFDALLDILEQRIAPFDVAAAREAADLMAARRKAGRPVEIRDTMIAGIALAQHASLATRNLADFADTRIPLVNPWSA
jgi:predicted nucleic acid-binding protein